MRVRHLAPIVALLFSGCTCSEQPAIVPPPTPTTQAVATPAPVEPTAVPPTAPAAPAAPQEPPAPPPTPTTDPAKLSACDRYVAVLSGRQKDPKALEDPELKAILAQAPEILTCGVVAADSDELCKKLLPIESGPTMECSNTWALFHELRNYPKGRSFMFTEIDWRDCRGVSVMPPGVCDGIRDALRAGDEKACAKAGDAESLCRAYMTLDKSLCRVSGKLATATFAMPDPKEGEPATINLKEAAEGGCRERIDSRGFLAKGLKELAESGPPRERALAKAALGDAAACTSLAAPALEACGSRAAGAAALAAPPPPTAAPPPTPASEGKPAETAPTPGGEKKGPESDIG